MKPMNMKRRQRGATLIVGLIMLVLITLVVSAAFMMSTTNLKSVGNMQFRDEALAAANAAIEQVISSDAVFFAVAAGTAPASQSISVGGYSVTVARPVCRYATPVATASSNDANPNLHNEDSSNIAVTGVPGFLDTYWDIAAMVNDGATGTRVDTHQGIKITLPEDPNPCP
jgi:hypothetical protein